MVDNSNLDNFEPLFIKGIISDPAVIATTNSFLKGTKKIFKNKDFAVLVGFYRYFFEKRERIPNLEEIKLSAIKELSLVEDGNALNEVRNKYLSKKGIVSSLMSKMKDL